MTILRMLPLGACALLAACAGKTETSQPVTETQITETQVTEVPIPAGGQLFSGLGDHSWTITTTSPEAQEYFRQGLAWMYAFNHDEAIRSFGKTAELDADCAMAWWGIALCHGPNYNDPVMSDQRSSDAWGALEQARERLDTASEKERALIEALSARYAKPWPEDRSALEQAYADAMAEVWADYPDDPDIGTLYAESMMVQRPWKLYSEDREPVGDTELIVATLERVLEMNPYNPGANHLYIHAIEPSRNPERAIEAANRLSGAVPAAGHLEHMPSHIYVQVGMWDEAITQNLKAIVADDRYLKKSPQQGIQHMYMVHNAHMLAYAAMMVGQEETAMIAARAMWSNVPDEVLEFAAPYVDLWMTSVYDVQKRFGRWDDIIAEPAPPEFLPITTAVWRAHRAIAFAAKKDFDAAEGEYVQFTLAKSAIPEDGVFGQDMTHRILDVSDVFIRAEIALQQEDWDGAIELLEHAAEIEDTLAYGEPPQWLQPVRHTLGAVYLKADRYEDAERVYRDDLDIWERNGWSLFGLSRALEGQGRDGEAQLVLELHQKIWAGADEPATTSCACLPDV